MAHPQRIAHYEVLAPIAQGGMAAVYRARDTRDGRIVALKQIHAHIANDPEFSRRFLHEAHMHEQLRHGNILEIFETGQTEGSYFIALELIDGGTLEAIGRAIGKFPAELALYVVHEMLQGLAHAHAKGITHRDIKPSNVMYTSEGAIKLADFGISKRDDLTRLTQTGEILGTPAYMSPEQASGARVDPRSDIFSAGVVLYEMLIGYNPFATDNPLTTITKIVEFQPVGLFDLDPTIPIEYETLVRRMLEKDPKARFVNVEEALTAVRESLTPLTPQGLAMTFRELLADPRGFTDQQAAQHANEHYARAVEVYKDGKGAVDAALWEVHQTLLYKEDHPEAQKLFSTIAQTQKLKPESKARAANPKIRELEDRLRDDPDNLANLLQLAKLYKLEQDLISVIKLYLRLKRVAPGDAYTMSQVDALLPGSGGTLIDVRRPGGGATLALAAPSASAVAGRTRVLRPAKPAAAAPVAPKKNGVVVAVAVAVVVIGLTLAVVVARRSGGPDADAAAAPSPSAAPSEAMRKLAAILGLGEPEEVQIDTSADLSDRFLTQAEEARDAGDLRKAIDLYGKFLAKYPDHAERTKVLLAVGSLYEATGKAALAEQHYEQVMKTGQGVVALEAQLRRGTLREKLGQDTAAVMDYRSVAASSNAEVAPRAHLALGLLNVSQGDGLLALTELETVVMRYPESPQVLPAQQALAPIYEKEGNLVRARETYEWIVANSAVGGPAAKAASKALARIGGGDDGGSGTAGEPAAFDTPADGDDAPSDGSGEIPPADVPADGAEPPAGDAPPEGAPAGEGASPDPAAAA